MSAAADPLRVLLIVDGNAVPPSLEADPLLAALAGVADVVTDELDLTAPGALERLGGHEAEVWVTDSHESLERVGRIARARSRRLVHRETRLVGQVTDESHRLLRALPLADALVVTSATAADWFRHQLGPTAPEIVAIPGWLAELPRPVSDLGSRRFAVAGPLVFERRPMRALRAFESVADLLPDWRLRFLGGGPHRKQLVTHATRVGLRQRVSYSGAGPTTALEWSEAAIAVFTPRVDPSVDALGAMAAGVPVVAYDVPGGVHDLVEHGVNGLLVPPGSHAALATAMHAVATETGLFAQLAAGARRTAAEHAEQQAPGTGLARWLEVLRGTAAAALPAPPADVAQPDTRGPVTGVGPTPVEARSAALRVAARAATDAGGPWFVLPGEPPRVVVAESGRDRLLASLRDGDTPRWLSVRSPAHGGWAGQRVAAAESTTLPGRPVTLVLEPWPTDRDGAPLLAAHGCAVALELWAPDADGWLSPPGPDPILGRVPASVATTAREVEGVEVPVPSLVAGPLLDDVSFGVDVVYTWVDGADPAWLRAREARLASVGADAADRTASGRARFESRDELRYSLRSLHLFAPWVRRIHLVTAGQTPAWLDGTDDRLRVVDHREILPAEALPTFSSHAIETRLHHLPDLAEHFVYVNDDVLLGRPLTPRTFFDPGGRAAVFCSTVPIGDPAPDAPAFLAAAANNRRLLAETFGVTITRTLAHTPHPHRVSVLREVEERYADAVARTTRSPFRARTDVSMLSSLAQHHGLLTGAAYEAEPSLAFIGLGTADLARQLATASERRQDFVCLGDHHDYALRRERVDALVADFLESYLPVRSPWESPD